MSYTLHWANTSRDIERGPSCAVQELNELDYKEKIGSLCPPIALQADTLYPSAFAHFSSNQTLGCKGHQIDEEFPLEAKVPYCLPLVQYPSPTKGVKLYEQDMCAKPVLNWEEYVKKLQTIRTPGGLARPSKEPSSSATTSESPDTLDDGEVDDEMEFDDGIPEKEKKIVNVTRLRNLIYAKSTKPNFDQKAKEDPNQVTPEEISEKLKEFSKSRTFKKDRSKIPLPCLRTYKNQPELAIRGTWNNLYGGGGSGALESIPDPESPDKKMILVGCGQKLRAVNIKPAKKSSMLSYSVDSIWEEDETNIPVSEGDYSPFDSIIYQIKASPVQPIAAVRRGKTIGIYNLKESPFLTSTLPKSSQDEDYFRLAGPQAIQDPLIVALDWDPELAIEILTLDENDVLRFCDITSEKSILFKGMNESNRKNTDSELPKFALNIANGACYSHSGVQIFHWANNKVHLIDKRGDANASEIQIPLFTETFDLKWSTSSLSWSDQVYFRENIPRELNEFISCVQQSGNPMYYYIGTTSRILLMDMRVPKHPVMRLSHGMRSPATYIEVYSDGDFEIVLAGSQRIPEIFCATLDYAHVTCKDGGRTHCLSRNPILTSYPRHLSNSKEFFDAAAFKGFCHGFPSEFNHTRDHCYAWCTGMSMIETNSQRDPSKPPGIAVFTGNNFGDIFLQEWHQKPIKRKIEAEDERLNKFLDNWLDSMKPGINDFLRESENPNLPIDCSLLVEPNASRIEHLPKIRNERFDVFKPEPLQFSEASKNTKPLEEQISELREYKGEFARRILDYWDDSRTRDDDTESVVSVSSEELSLQEASRKEVEPDDIADVEIKEEYMNDEEMVNINEMSGVVKAEPLELRNWEDSSSEIEVLAPEPIKAPIIQESLESHSEGSIAEEDLFLPSQPIGEPQSQSQSSMIQREEGDQNSEDNDHEFAIPLPPPPKPITFKSTSKRQGF